jgi:hypothetical protein
MIDLVKLVHLRLCVKCPASRASLATNLLHCAPTSCLASAISTESPS